MWLFFLIWATTYILRSHRLFPLNGEIYGVNFLWCLFLFVSEKVYFQERNSCFLETIGIQASRNNNTSSSQYPTNNTLCRLLLGHILALVLFMSSTYFWALLHFSIWSLFHTHIYPCMCKLSKTASLFLFGFVFWIWRQLHAYMEGLNDALQLL